MSSLVRVPAVSIGGVVVAVHGDQLFAGGSVLCPENAEQLAKRAGFENAKALREAIERRPKFALIDTRDGAADGHGVELFESEAEAIRAAVSILEAAAIVRRNAAGLWEFCQYPDQFPGYLAGDVLREYQESYLGLTECFHVVPIRKAVTQ